MLLQTLKHSNSAICTRVKKFGLATKTSPPFFNRSKQLIFLCGANQSSGVPSARRDAIKQFIEGQSPDFKVIYAEGVFNEITKFGHDKNVLDLEHEISEIADKILIVLESPSAFCELGAFAHKNLRTKLIIINNSEFKSQKSFINTGPIAAAAEIKSPVLWYPMAPDGIFNIDGIGTIFKELKDSIQTKSQSRRQRISGDISVLEAKKTSLFFVHDLVYFAGPISHEELISFLIVAFGKKSYDMLKRLLGVLRSANLIRSFDVSGTWIYESIVGSPFLEYNTNFYPLMATIRSFHFRTQPERFKR